MLLEFYHKNPLNLKNKTDSSGLRLYMTPDSFSNDIGVLAITSDSSPLSLQIPANSKHFYHSIICYPQCVEKFVPDEGISLFSGVLYTHLAGVSVKLSIIRDGKLIARLFENENFDSRFQHAIDIKPVKIVKVSKILTDFLIEALNLFINNKGDSLLLECEYDTEDRSSFTLVCLNVTKNCFLFI